MTEKQDDKKIIKEIDKINDKVQKLYDNAITLLPRVNMIQMCTELTIETP